MLQLIQILVNLVFILIQFLLVLNKIVHLKYYRQLFLNLSYVLNKKKKNLILFLSLSIFQMNYLLNPLLIQTLLIYLLHLSESKYSIKFSAILVYSFYQGYYKLYSIIFLLHPYDYFY